MKIWLLWPSENTVIYRYLEMKLKLDFFPKDGQSVSDYKSEI